MKTLVSAAATLAIVSLAAAQSVNASDLIYSTKSHHQPRKVVQLPDEVRPCSGDILCRIRPYNGFRDPSYTGCRKVRVREITPDGSVGIRRLVAC
jgi:hypothetical protein